MARPRLSFAPWPSACGAAAAFLIDYGFPEREYYHPQRHGGTLMCHHLHRSDPDPLVLVGEKDITAHINFTGIALAGQEAGLEVLGYTSQAHFLWKLRLGRPARRRQRGRARHGPQAGGRA